MRQNARIISKTRDISNNLNAETCPLRSWARATIVRRDIVLSLCVLIWHAASSIRQPVINNKLASGGAVSSERGRFDRHVTIARVSATRRCTLEFSRWPRIMSENRGPCGYSPTDDYCFIIEFIVCRATFPWLATLSPHNTIMHVRDLTRPPRPLFH